MEKKLVYFAWLKERLGVSEETVSLPKEIESINDLMNWQKTRGAPFADIFEDADIIQVALDRKHAADRGTSIAQANEIAMFPPMTGG